MNNFSSLSSGTMSTETRVPRSHLSLPVSRGRARQPCWQSRLCALGGLLDNAALSMASSDMEPEVERLFLYSMAWAIGGRFDAEDRIKFDQWMRQILRDAKGIVLWKG